MISHKRNWASVGKEYQNLIAPQIKNAIAVKEKAYEVRGNAFKKQVMINSIIDWIRKSVTYEHIPFGDRSLIPVTALTTLKSRKGDCKDQSLLLKEMLSALGIKSNLTLIHLDAPVSHALPSLQQFNHMILHIPAGEGYSERYVDLTEKGGSNRVIPYHLENKYALLIAGDSSKLISTPKVENSDEHWAHFHHTLALDKGQVLQIKDSLVLSGKFGVGFRDKLWALNEIERRKLLKDWLSFDVPEVNVQEVKAENMESHDKPLKLTIYYSIPNLFVRNESNWVGNFPNIWERVFMRLPRLRKRHHPIRLPHEMVFQSSVTLKKGAYRNAMIELDSINSYLE